MTMPASREDLLDPAYLAQWVGRSETRTDVIGAAPIAGLAATLDLAIADQPGAELPPLWHWLYFLPRAPQAELGQDGHPRTGGFLPALPLPRRMWAGGRLQWHAPLHVGEVVHRISRIQDIKHKQGRQGDLVFVTVLHEIHGARGLAIREEQDLVYRDPTPPGQAAPEGQPAPATATARQDLTPDPALLFRFSALTFNAHRIHYDLPYATGEEGYPGLVVHGPLQATLLAGLAMRHARGAVLSHFEFRGMRPAFAGHALGVRAGEATADGQLPLWAQDDQGCITMQASARFASGTERST